MHIEHVVVAFWLSHEWSHTKATDHVKNVGGFGEGILANELFLIIWAIDVAWWWAKPAHYAARGRGFGIAIHGYLIFMMFNATVVFGGPAIRAIGLLLFGVLAGLWGRRPLSDRSGRTGQDERQDGSTSQKPESVNPE